MIILNRTTAVMTIASDRASCGCSHVTKASPVKICAGGCTESKWFSDAGFQTGIWLASKDPAGCRFRYLSGKLVTDREHQKHSS
jgi:hypothetical protein